jgi:hypothetical protein
LRTRWSSKSSPLLCQKLHWHVQNSTLPLSSDKWTYVILSCPISVRIHFNIILLSKLESFNFYHLNICIHYSLSQAPFLLTIPTLNTLITIDVLRKTQTSPKISWILI